MEEMQLIKGDSSDIYQFSSKQVSILGSTWEGSWVVSDELGGVPVIEGILAKNENIFNEDSLVNEDFRKTFKIFESTGLEKLEFNEDVIQDEICTVSGRIFRDGTDANGNTIEIPENDKYVTITLKGVFAAFTREERIKTESDGTFSYDFNIGKTVKTPANSFFIFQLMPLQSELLEVGSYFLSVEVRENDTNDNVIFRREVLQEKLKITTQGVL